MTKLLGLAVGGLVLHKVLKDSKEIQECKKAIKNLLKPLKIKGQNGRR